MISFIIKTYIYNSFNHVKKVIFKIFYALFFCLNIFLLYQIFSIPGLDKKLIQNSQKINLGLGITLIFLLVIYKFRIQEHKSLFLLPVKKHKLTITIIMINFFKYQLLFWIIISYIFVLTNYPEIKIILKIICIIIFTIYLSLSLFNFKLAIYQKSKNIFDYIPFLNLLFIFVFPITFIAYCLIFIFISLLRLNFLVNNSQKIASSPTFLNISFNIKKDILFNKEIKLLLNNKKGLSLVVTSLLAFILIFIVYTFISPHLKRTEGLDIFIFLLASGYSMNEYFQYIFCWDYKNIGSQITLPLDYKYLIISKLKIIYLVLFFHSLLSFLIIGLKFHPAVIYIIFIFNFILIPHLFIIIALSSYKKNMHIEKSILNINYYQRPLKLIIFVSLIYLIEFLSLFLFPEYKIRLFFGILTLTSTLILFLFREKIIAFYVCLYKKWLRNFIRLEESSYVF